MAYLNGFFSLLAEKSWNFFFFHFKKRALCITNFVKVMINNIGHRTSYRPIQIVIIHVIKQIGLPRNRIGLHSVLLPLLIIYSFLISYFWLDVMAMTLTMLIARKKQLRWTTTKSGRRTGTLYSVAQTHNVLTRMICTQVI